MTGPPDGAAPLRDAPIADGSSVDGSSPDASMPAGALGPCPPSGDCDDGSACNGTIECIEGWCFPGSDALVCDDEIECTVDGCRDPDGVCESVPDDTMCDDMNDCTVDSCAVLGCANVMAVDGSPCATGACIEGSCCEGCVDESGGCQPGTSLEACGTAGIACSPCPCASDRCEGAGCPPDYLRVVQVAAGEYHTCARTLSGEIYCWGRNIHGQLGLGDRTMRRRPTPVGSERDWIDITTLHSHVCGIRLSDGRRRLYCWGSGTSGQLGTGAATTASSPQAVMTERTDWQEVSTGQFHTCSRSGAGQLFCWGSDAAGQLGIPGSTGQLVPSQVGVGADYAVGWQSISVGGEHTCGVRRPIGSTDGLLYCWGGGSVAALGLGDRMSRSEPTQLLATMWAQTFMGYQHSCALQLDGHLACWGLNRSGQAAVRDEVFVLMPRGADGSTDWTSVGLNGSAPPFSGGNTCAVQSGGSLWCWGEASGGRLGMGSAVTEDLYRPTRVGTSSDWHAVTVGGRHACAVKRDGSLWCWGDGSSGQLGLNDLRMRNEPVRVCFPD